MQTESDVIEPRRYVVVGAGGVGGHLLSALCRMLEHKSPGSVVLIIDGDEYEPGNADRQEFTTLGNKAEVKSQELQPQFHNIFIVPDKRWVVDEIPDYIKAEENQDEIEFVEARKLLQENDVVFATVDNFAARKAIFDAAREFQDIHVFTGGNDDHLFGSTYHYARKDGEDLIDHPSDYHPELVDPPDKNPGELSCEERANLPSGQQTIAANMMVATVLIGRTHETIFDGKEDIASEIYFDLSLGKASCIDRRVEDREPANA